MAVKDTNAQKRKKLKKIKRKIKKRTHRVIEIKHQMSAAGENEGQGTHKSAKVLPHETPRRGSSNRKEKMAATWLTTCKRAWNLNFGMESLQVFWQK